MSLGLVTGGLGTPQAVSAAPRGVTASPTVTALRGVTASPTFTASPGAAVGNPAPAGTAVAITAVTAQPVGARVVAEAARHKGKRYLYGATGPARFDCSGFTMYVYRKTTGRKLPHKANLQQRYGKAVSRAAARPGDLIIIRKGSRGTHAGIYAGDGTMWSAPRTGKTVTRQKIWSRNYVVRRLA
ncbi:C40 family peptidase [Actinoplanes sp. CA-252034]|uniref:C40 family peptidase n=1 Tax=Actinoplanes sp. CA-252034 TaxID=3239906 RepID=UPI003D97CB33